MGSPLDQARHVRDQLKVWLLEHAYPLWADAGRDPGGGFFEKIGQDGAPVEAPRRVRVAARQTYAYALAAGLGWRGDWRAVVEHGLAAMERYRRADGFYAILMSPDGEVLDDTPAPYEQAFVMLALSAAQQALGRGFEREAVAVREALIARLGRPDGGFYETLPHTAPLRANPHMHLLESALAWAEVGEDAGWLRMAAGIAETALARMIEPATGALCELYDDDWTPLPDADVEPGHQFEWGWLLIKYARLAGRDAAAEAGARMIEVARAHGVDGRGVAFNALDQALKPRDLTARLWPQTERLKAAVATGDWEAAALAGQGLRKYLDTPAPGLWFDRMNPDGSFIDEPAPASSFYHIVGAILDLDRAVIC